MASACPTVRYTGRNTSLWECPSEKLPCRWVWPKNDNRAEEIIKVWDDAKKQHPSMFEEAEVLEVERDENGLTTIKVQRRIASNLTPVRKEVEGVDREKSRGAA